MSKYPASRMERGSICRNLEKPRLLFPWNEQKEELGVLSPRPWVKESLVPLGNLKPAIVLWTLSEGPYHRWVPLQMLKEKPLMPLEPFVLHPVMSGEALEVLEEALEGLEGELEGLEEGWEGL